MKIKGLTRRQFLIGSGLTGALVLTSGPRLRLEAAATPAGTEGALVAQLQGPDVPTGVAANPTPTPKKPRITQADREAAAARAEDKGFVLGETGVDQAALPGEAPRYFSHPNYANSKLPITDPVTGAYVSGGIRKFIDGLPGLGAGKANNLGQYIPVAVKDETTYPGSDYYEIGLVQYREKMHTDLEPTLLRGYVQLSTSVVPGDEVPLSNALLDGSDAPTGYAGVTPPHYLGPAIVATKGKPVRVLFRNLLPAGVDGNLFIPCDVTVMGAGMGPNLAGMPEVDPQHPLAGEVDPINGKNPDCFAENRATLHLHGGLTPWISDGTPHQWVTPADQVTSYPKGVSVAYVPDMPDPGPGALTFFYTNDQSARLMFYHDHAWGITRLNVYAGEAAPYIITDAMEQELIVAGVLPGPEDTIPLVVQDKTFVPPAEQLAASDETWDTSRWGGEDNLWLPHVYSPAQNPGDSSGVNQFGRWAYGPWFWPPTNNINYGPIANPYYDPNCDPDVQWCEPPLMPGAPFNSMGMEAFLDTPVVNGTAYPTLTVEPKAYRFRLLNAANDRSFNLSFYQADPLAPTEVQLNPAEVAAALDDPTIFPTPLAGTEGPDWIQIGNEGGFLPAPAILPAQPTTWVNDPTVFNAGNVDLHSLLIAPAERADVIVDFSAFAGQTLILYNDAPAAFPARDPRYDYYTGDGDYRDTGGTPPTLPGYGPNTRTVMQVIVSGTPAPTYDVDALVTAFKAESLGGLGVFKNSQHPIIVGQGAYNSAYGTTFQENGPNAGLVQIFDQSLTFKTLSGGAAGPSLTIPLMPKQIQDEMGEAFDHEYGRMSGFLGLESPNPQAGLQNMILYPFVNPASELIDSTNLPKSDVTVAPISVATDGTQIWKITHNGVDTHPIHVHLYDVQLINRVGWDGIIRKPEPNELGWRETVRVSPLEDTIVALRPVIPVVPWDLPNSVRPLHPMMPLGSSIGFNNQDAWGDPTVPIINAMTNFGHEYVWHCHILSHEEMDMMRPQSLAIAPLAPSGLQGSVTGTGDGRRVTLTWVDNSLNETGFVVQRAAAPGGPWTDVGTVGENVTTYADEVGAIATVLYYQVLAVNEVGYNATPGYSTLTLASGPSNVYQQDPAAAAPTNVQVTGAVVNSNARMTVTWVDNATTESSYQVQRATNSAFTGAVTTTLGANTTSLVVQGLTRGVGYYFRVRALSASGNSVWVNATPFPITVVGPAAAPTNVQVSGVAASATNARFTVTWQDNANNESSYQVRRATNASMTGSVTTNVAANATSLVVQGLSRGVAYYFQVRAISASGNSAWVNATPSPITVP